MHSKKEEKFEETPGRDFFDFDEQLSENGWEIVKGDMLVVLKETPLFVFENMKDSLPEEKPEMLEDKPEMLMLEDMKYDDVANELMVPPPPQLVRQQPVCSRHRMMQ